MADPAPWQEFKDDVAAVLAEKHGHGERKAALEKLRAEGLTERGWQLRKKGIANLEFHFPGAAKILDGGGKGLAGARAELKQLKK